MSKYLDQMKNELIADLTVENNLLKNSNKVLINQKTLLHKRVQELDIELNKFNTSYYFDLEEENKKLKELVKHAGYNMGLVEKHLKQRIWTNDGDL